MVRRLLAAIVLWGLGAADGVTGDGKRTDRPPTAEQTEFFEKHVRPVLAENCLSCHGPKKQMSGLRLDSREAVLAGGDNGPAIRPGDPDNSPLIQAVRHQGARKMPPKKRLAAAQVNVLSAWVKMGAPWPAAHTIPFEADAWKRHWAFQPVANPRPPTVKQTDWPRTPIDRFILSRLEAKGLRPSLAADRHTLLRRVTFDLTGLPPTPEETAAFEADRSPDAWAKVVDRLLSSPHYGERWSRHWLDVARYADTKDGVLMYGDDRVRPYAYTYRDYVIRAFNEDLPFDRFIHEQLAADAIEPKVEPWRLGAMGFLTLGRQYDNNLHDVIDDRIDTVTRGLLGMTVSCARCHDHKYDAIPT